jgi:hypothetical protein
MRSPLHTILLGFSFAFFILAGLFIHRSAGQTVVSPPGPTRWEYKVDTNGTQEHQLNLLGDQGWELVTISENAPNIGYILVYKRPKQ